MAPETAPVLAPQTAPLADGKQVQAVMPSEDVAVQIKYRTGRCFEPGLPVEKITVIVFVDKTDILAFFRGGRFQP